MDYRIKQVLTVIENEFPRSPELKKLAAAENTSVSHLQHLFKKEVSVSIKQYVKNLRLEKARILLETTNLRVKEICSEVGYGDISHFLRDFSNAFGSSPKKYRMIFHSLVAKKPIK